jgi:hypothetical protein
MIIALEEVCGSFAENKDQARELRENFIKPALAKKKRVTLDFTGVDSSTQSFIHALISAVFQEHGEQTLEKMYFKGCNKALQSLITTVINYSLE